MISFSSTKFKCNMFYTFFYVVLYVHKKSLIKSTSQTSMKNSIARAFNCKLLPGLTHSGHCKLVTFKKKMTPIQLFFNFAPNLKCFEFTPAFKYISYKHTFWHVVQKEGMYGIHIFLVHTRTWMLTDQEAVNGYAYSFWFMILLECSCRSSVLFILFTFFYSRATRPRKRFPRFNRFLR